MPKILLVEDEKHWYRLFEVTLDRLGDFEFRTARNGQHGLEVLMEFQPDVIVTDMVMGPGHGREFVPAVRSERRFDTTHLLVYTAWPYDQEVVQELYSNGADGYFVKGGDFIEFAAEVGRISQTPRVSLAWGNGGADLVLIEAGIDVATPEAFYAKRDLLTELVRGANLLDVLKSIDPEEFENLIAKLLTKIGMSVKLTQFRKDGGIDLVVTERSAFTTNCYYVQCKHYLERPVGVEAVRELYGVVSTDNVTKGLLVSSGSFTGPAKEHQARIANRMDLADQRSIQAWVDWIRRS